jgi:hypothetical protein
MRDMMFLLRVYVSLLFGKGAFVLGGDIASQPIRR